MTAVASLRISGQFVDAFVYRTQLYAVTTTGKLRAYDVSDIEERATREHGEVGRALTYHLFHTKGMGANEQQRAARLRFTNTDAFDKLTITLEGDELPSVEREIGFPSYEVLDVLIYNDRLYLATDTGLWSALLRGAARDLELNERLPYRCFSAKVSRGAVAASCGDEGLNVIFDDFSWLGRTRKDVPLPRSLRCSYASLGLVNYTSRSSFEMLQGETRQIPDEPSTSAFVSFSASDFGTAALLERLQALIEDLSVEKIDYIFNDGSQFAVFAGGLIIAVQTQYSQGEGRRRSLTPRIVASYEGNVVDAQPLGGGMVVETHKAVSFVHRDVNRAVEVHNGPVSSVRSFPRSYRYQELAVAVGEHCLTLVAALRDRPHSGR